MKIRLSLVLLTALIVAGAPVFAGSTKAKPGATAYATSYKGSDKGISVAPWSITIDAVKADPAKFIPLATVLEGAKLTGHGCNRDLQRAARDASGLLLPLA